jgi:excisionase family DNA binding protein
LRDCVCKALEAVTAAHAAALSAPPEEILADLAANLVGSDGQLDQHLFQAIAEAQAIWFDTPARRYLEREKAVYLRSRDDRPNGLVNGSCFHDLALAVALWTWKCIEAETSTRDFVRELRYRTAAGDQVGQHLFSLRPLVAAECASGIEKHRLENAISHGAPATHEGEQTAPDQGGTGQDREEGWCTVTEAATVANCNKGTVSRAIDSGNLRGNGKSGDERRIDRADLTRWILARSNLPEREESVEAVERKWRKATGD